MLTMAVARSFSGGVVIRYVIPVLWMTSYLLISKGCSTSPLTWSECTRSLGYGYKLCAVIPVAARPTDARDYFSGAYSNFPGGNTGGGVCGLWRYDTIRDAILTCARKPTWVGLIYRTETTTKNCKTEKLKSKNRYVTSNSKSLGNRVVSCEEEEERLQWEGFAEKEGFKSGTKERVGDGKLIITSVTVRGVSK